MPETPEEWYERVSAGVERDGYRPPTWPSWPNWPFDGELVPRPLRPLEAEPVRGGERGQDCFMCAADRAADGSYLVWRDEIAMLGMPQAEVALPLVAFLMVRRHADLRDLTPSEAGRLGELLTHAERAACDVLDVPRLQVMRFGEGQEHLHWWLLARPRGATQLRGTAMLLWDDLLPPRDRAAVRADLDLVAARLVELAGGEVLTAPLP